MSVTAGWRRMRSRDAQLPVGVRRALVLLAVAAVAGAADVGHRLLGLGVAFWDRIVLPLPACVAVASGSILGREHVVRRTGPGSVVARLGALP